MVAETDKKYIELAEAVKTWWEAHKFDVTVGGGEEYEEYNVFDDEPDFVTKAKEIIGDWEKP